MLTQHLCPASSQGGCWLHGSRPPAPAPAPAHLLLGLLPSSAALARPCAGLPGEGGGGWWKGRMSELPGGPAPKAEGEHGEHVPGLNSCPEALHVPPGSQGRPAAWERRWPPRLCRFAPSPTSSEKSVWMLSLRPGDRGLGRVYPTWATSQNTDPWPFPGGREKRGPSCGSQ